MTDLMINDLWWTFTLMLSRDERDMTSLHYEWHVQSPEFKTYIVRVV